MIDDPPREDKITKIDPRSSWIQPVPHASRHASHPAIVNRLKRCGGHLRRVVEMLETHAPCVDVAQQLHAVEAAVAKAKRELIQDHLDHCLTGDGDAAARLDEMKRIAKFL
jgi:hypothetical protein NreA